MIHIFFKNKFYENKEVSIFFYLYLPNSYAHLAKNIKNVLTFNSNSA